MIFKWLIYFIQTELNKYKRSKWLHKKFPRAKIAMGAQLSDEADLGINTAISDQVIIRGKVSIGRASFINGPSRVVAAYGSEITIGPFCSIAAYTCMFSGNHPLDAVSTFQSANSFYKDIFTKEGATQASIEIGADVWIGTHAVILAGVKIGNGAVIAAGSIVTKDVEAFSIVAGAPAKLVRYRFDENKREYLNQLEWWNWSDEELSKQQSFFKQHINDMELNTLKQLVSSVATSKN